MTSGFDRGDRFERLQDDLRRAKKKIKALQARIAELEKELIHVAPCSCELHVRIRELEAELHLAKAEWKGMDAAWHREQARAEKAEAEAERAWKEWNGVDKCREIWIQRAKENRTRYQTAEARVAELTDALRRLWEEGPAVPVSAEVAKKVFDEIEAREREAD